MESTMSEGPQEVATLQSLAEAEHARAEAITADPTKRIPPPIRFTLGRSKTVWEVFGWSRTKKRRVRIGRFEGEGPAARHIIKSVSPERLAKIVKEDNGAS
jgi:hypothetical protein